MEALLVKKLCCFVDRIPVGAIGFVARLFGFAAHRGSGVARPRALAICAVSLVFASFARFVVPALEGTHGAPPAPLDDVFIHFNFARAAAAGHPFEWIAGEGYLRRNLAAVRGRARRGCIAGFQNESRSLRARVRVRLSRFDPRFAAAPRASTVPLGWLARCRSRVLVSSAGRSGVAWRTLSTSRGLVRALVHARRSQVVAHVERPELEQRLAALFTLLVLTRPESPVLVAPLAVYVAGASRWPVRSLVRTSFARGGHDRRTRDESSVHGFVGICGRNSNSYGRTRHSMTSNEARICDERRARSREGIRQRRGADAVAWARASVARARRSLLRTLPQLRETAPGERCRLDVPGLVEWRSPISRTFATTYPRSCSWRQPRRCRFPR